MPSNPVLERLHAGEASFGGWIGFASSYVAELMGRAGFDWVGLDSEHGVINPESLQAMIQALHTTNTVPIVRLPEASELAVKRALDMGARGVIAPMVKTAETASLLVRSARFPPDGFRSVGGGRWHFTFDGAAPPAVNPQVLAAVMIEHVEAVENVESILSVQGLDCYFIGPTDLGASLGYKPDEVTDAIGRVLQAGKKLGVPGGIHVASPELARERAAQGFQFIAVSEAGKLVADGATQLISSLKG